MRGKKKKEKRKKNSLEEKGRKKKEYWRSWTKLWLSNFLGWAKEDKKALEV